MDIQEIEEMYYNPQTEFQNAFAQSRIETELFDPRIGEALNRGKFVVVASVPQFCRSTDAFIGDRKSYDGEFDTFDQANEAAQSFNQNNDCDIYWDVQSPPSESSAEPQEDDIPF